MGILKFVVAAVLVIAVAAIGFVYLAPERFTELMLHLDRRAAGLVRKEIDLPGGLHYVYLEGGKGEPLVLLHGFGGMKDNFARVARFLTPRYRVIVPDEIGFAESSHPPDADYGSQAQAERVHALAQALGIGRARSPVSGCWIRPACGVHRRGNSGESLKPGNGTRSSSRTKRTMCDWSGS